MLSTSSHNCYNQPSDVKWWWIDHLLVLMLILVITCIACTINIYINIIYYHACRIVMPYVWFWTNQNRGEHGHVIILYSASVMSCTWSWRIAQGAVCFRNLPLLRGSSQVSLGGEAWPQQNRLQSHGNVHQRNLRPVWYRRRYCSQCQL